MLVLVFRPAAHDGDRAVEVGDEEMPDGEFRRAEPGEEFQRIERQVEMFPTVERDEFGQA